MAPMVHEYMDNVDMEKKLIGLLAQVFLSRYIHTYSSYICNSGIIYIGGSRSTVVARKD